MAFTMRVDTFTRWTWIVGQMMMAGVAAFGFQVALGQSPGGRPGGPGARGPGGPGGPPMGVQPDLPLVKTFDKDTNGWLNRTERSAAREFLAKEKAEGRGPRRPGPRGGEVQEEKVASGRKIVPADVHNQAGAELFDSGVLRTLFLTFEESDWEKMLMEFYHTDVEVPARLMVDGKNYDGVGVRFRGASSFFTVREGLKHSMNLSLDLINRKQRLYGAKTLNLLNSHTDPTYMRSVLFCHVARQFLPAYRANHVRVVVNGESWGIYVNVEQFNSDFTHDRFGSMKGARWKVPGSPRGRGNLDYLGSDPAPYKTIYDIKTKDTPESWAKLAELCKALKEQSGDKPTAALEKILDVDGALRFLALENVFINCDGYWIRSSDYNLYLDEKGKFHVVPHDSNETFREPEGPGWNGGGNGAAMDLDPLYGAGNAEKPLINKLLSVPEYQKRYLGYVRSMAEDWLDWKRLEPIVSKAQLLIKEDVQLDSHRLNSADSFTKGVTGDIEEPGFRGPSRVIGLKTFADQRRAFLLAHPKVKETPRAETK